MRRSPKSPAWWRAGGRRRLAAARRRWRSTAWRRPLSIAICEGRSLPVPPPISGVAGFRGIPGRRGADQGGVACRRRPPAGAVGAASPVRPRFPGPPAGDGSRPLPCPVQGRGAHPPGEWPRCRPRRARAARSRKAGLASRNGRSRSPGKGSYRPRSLIVRPRSSSTALVCPAPQAVRRRRPRDLWGSRRRPLPAARRQASLSRRDMAARAAAGRNRSYPHNARKGPARTVPRQP